MIGLRLMIKNIVTTIFIKLTKFYVKFILNIYFEFIVKLFKLSFGHEQNT